MRHLINRRLGIILKFLVIIVVLGYYSKIDALVPMQVQGVVSDQIGRPSQSTPSIELKLYDAPTSGALLITTTPTPNWTSTTRFSVLIAGLDPEFYQGSSRYLEVKMNNSDTLLPRIPLTTVPYSFLAASAGSTDTKYSLLYSENGQLDDRFQVSWRGSVGVRNSEAWAKLDVSTGNVQAKSVLRKIIPITATSGSQTINLDWTQSGIYQINVDLIHSTSITFTFTPPTHSPSELTIIIYNSSPSPSGGPVLQFPSNVIFGDNDPPHAQMGVGYTVVRMFYQNPKYHASHTSDMRPMQ